MTTQASILPATGRLLIAAIFLISGVMKIAAPEMTRSYIAAAGLPAPIVAYVVAVVIEIVGGIFLVLGFRTRTAAGVIALYCVATALSFHANFADANQTMSFLKNICMAGGLLQIVAFGAGSLSLDRLRAHRSADSTAKVPRESNALRGVPRSRSE